MRVKDAILVTMSKGQLRKVASALSVTDCDLNDVNEMTEIISRHPRASAEYLLSYLPDAKLEEVIRFVPSVATPTRVALLRAAQYDESNSLVETPKPIQMPSSPPSTVKAGVVDGLIPIGGLVRWNDQLGVVDRIDRKHFTVKFDSGSVQGFAADADVLKRVELKAGDQVTRFGDPVVGVVLEALSGSGFPTWKVSFPSGLVNVSEMGLRPAVLTDPLARMKAGRLGTASDFNLRAVAADYWYAHLHDELVSLAHARVDLKPHQVSVVHKVISNYPHRFLLCDEVGLGKTIEAAMIVKELRARGEAKRVLILVPSGLTQQWQFELKTKFNESFAIYNSDTVRYLRDKGVLNPWTDTDSVIASHAWASWTADRVREITNVAWDLVIVDEAHHARVHSDGTRTLLVRLVQALVARREYARRAALMLTATPLQLDRSELYSLVEMLDPILFASESDFDRHIQSLAGLNKTVEELEGMAGLDEASDPELVEEVAHFLNIGSDEARATLDEKGSAAVGLMLRDRHRLSEIMIRNRKSVVQGFQPRSAYRWEVKLSAEELRIHRLMDEIFEQGFKVAEETNQAVVGFLMVILQKLLASSPRALLKSLRKRRDKLAGGPRVVSLTPDDLEEELESDTEASEVLQRLAPTSTGGQFDQVIGLLENLGVDTKAEVLIANLGELISEEADAKVLIFTEFRETQDMLLERLGSHWAVNKFHGQMSADQKDSEVEAFRSGKGPHILISTEAGGEGRNFQFCHRLVNYDLPWNPMRVEQRIGRVDRIGQLHPITIFNFHVQGTIEGRILDVLEKRIRIFEEAVGGLDPILGKAEGSIRQALKLSRDDRDRAIDKLGKTLEAEIKHAINAELQLQDFIMQDKSYTAGIAQTALQQKAPISQQEFEDFLARLLISVNSYMYPKLPNGERRVVFHVPFTIDYPELIRDGESRRVCFDPRLNVDSELVEYLGFGHPIVDALVCRVTQEKPEGMAAVRSVSVPDLQPGWQFNWQIVVGGLKPRTLVFPVFVSDAGVADLSIGARLLRLSREFAKESSDAMPVLSSLDEAHKVAESAASDMRDRMLDEARRLASERADIEEARLVSFHEHRTVAAMDRIQSCQATLERLRASDEQLVRQAVPLWEANLVRAEGELQAVDEDLHRSRVELATRRNPAGEFTLLNVARIMVRELV
jgi:ATP-dependent helicase HepA